MLTNDFFKDLYNDRWGDPAKQNAVEPYLSDDKDHVAAQGILGRLACLFRRRRKRPSAWSFTIPSETSDTESDASSRHRNQCDIMQPKFLNVAKALSRNC
ncbi:MAG TPA: hypothetical protein VGC14_06700 [Rhizobium sp.]